MPPILLGIAASHEGAENPLRGVLIFEFPAVASGLLLAFSSPDPPNIEGQFTAEKIEELKKYTRFPLGLNKGQLLQLAKLQGQQKIRIIRPSIN